MEMNLTQFIYHDLLGYMQSKQQLFLQSYQLQQQQQQQECKFQPYNWLMCMADFCYCNTLLRPPAMFHEQMFQNKTLFDDYIEQKQIYITPINLYQLIERMTHFQMISIEGHYLCKFLIDKFLESTKSTLTMENFWLIFVVGIQIAMKFIEDCPFNNYSFGYVCCTQVNVINKLELFFLQKINYMINYEEFTMKHYSQLLL